MTHKKALAEIVAAPGFKAEVERARRRLDAEEAGWAVMEPSTSKALRAVVRAAQKWANAPSCALETPLLRALRRLEKLREEP